MIPLRSGFARAAFTSEETAITDSQPLAPELIEDLLVANKILFKKGIVDAFGHVSVRHDKDPNRYVMSRHLAPALVAADDLITYDLDSNAIPETSHRLYSERYIHGEIYKARPDVQSVVHCHAPALLPFANSPAELLPVYHMSGFLGAGVPTFDARERFGMTSMLVRTAPMGQALAEAIGDHAVVLMRGHGATMVGASIRAAVYRAIYATQNAQIELDMLRVAPREQLVFLAPEEADAYERYSGEVMHRPWNLWAREVAEDSK